MCQGGALSPDAMGTCCSTTRHLDYERKKAEKQTEANEKTDGGNKGGGEKKGGGKQQPKVDELKVNLCCDTCSGRLKRKIEKLNGVNAPVPCDINNSKVTVMASADTKPETVLKQARKSKKDTAMWPKEQTEKKVTEKRETEKTETEKTETESKEIEKNVSDSGEKKLELADVTLGPRPVSPDPPLPPLPVPTVSLPKVSIPPVSSFPSVSMCHSTHSICSWSF